MRFCEQGRIRGLKKDGYIKNSASLSISISLSFSRSLNTLQYKINGF